MTAAAQVQVFDRNDRVVTKVVRGKDEADVNKKVDRLEEQGKLLRVVAWEA